MLPDKRLIIKRLKYNPNPLPCANSSSLIKHRNISSRFFGRNATAGIGYFNFVTLLCALSNLILRVIDPESVNLLALSNRFSITNDKYNSLVEQKFPLLVIPNDKLFPPCSIVLLYPFLVCRYELSGLFTKKRRIR